MSGDLQTLQARLGHSFRDPAALREALTHRSAGSPNNERLEFLGDSVLSFLVAEMLYRERPAADEGRLSRLRASLVRGETLAQLARELELGAVLNLGSGEMKSGGHRRTSILSDAFEAVLGALYLDGGLAPCRRLVEALLGPRLAELGSGAELKDPKTRLQEWLQARRKPLPEYAVVAVSGEDHRQTFTVECRLADPPVQVQASARSRRKAEQGAAREVLARLLPQQGEEA